MGELPRKWITADNRGRCTLPKYMLKALGALKEDTDNVGLLVEAYPNLEKCTCLIVKKGTSDAR